MYSVNDIKVELMNPEEVKNFIKNHGVFACQCYMTPEKFAERVGLSCLKDGHTSGSRADYFKFRIKCPRYSGDQIMRHSIGTAINCQSQRYVDMDNNFSIFVPQKVMEDEDLRKMYQAYENNCREQYKTIREKMNKREITGEQANDLMRTMLPIGVECNITMGFTVEALIHFMHKRLCKRADAPIRKVAQLMREEVLKIEPRYKDFLVPQCVDLLYCPEKATCGMYPSKKEVQELINLGKNCCKNKPEAPGFPIDLNKK